MIQQPTVRPTEMRTNVRVESFGGLPHQPIAFQSACIGPRVASRIRREASAAPRRITQDAASAIEHPRDADDDRYPRGPEDAGHASDRCEDRQRGAADQERRQRQRLSS